MTKWINNDSNVEKNMELKLTSKLGLPGYYLLFYILWILFVSNFVSYGLASKFLKITTFIYFFFQQEYKIYFENLIVLL